MADTYECAYEDFFVIDLNRVKYYRFIPESARWLLAKGKDAEAEGIIRTAAKVNQVEIPEELFRRIEGSVRQEQSIISIRHTRRLIIRTAVISFNWWVNGRA